MHRTGLVAQLKPPSPQRRRAANLLFFSVFSVHSVVLIVPQGTPYATIGVLGRPVTFTFCPSFQRPSFLSTSMRSKRLSTFLFFTDLFDFPKLGCLDICSSLYH